MGWRATICIAYSWYPWKLTNQDSEGGKNWTVLAPMQVWERHCISLHWCNFSRGRLHLIVKKGIYIFKIHAMIVESENNVDHFASQIKLAQSLEQPLILIKLTILTFPFPRFCYFEYYDVLRHVTTIKTHKNILRNFSEPLLVNMENPTVHDIYE